MILWPIIAKWNYKDKNILVKGTIHIKKFMQKNLICPKCKGYIKLTLRNFPPANMCPNCKILLERIDIPKYCLYVLCRNPNIRYDLIIGMYFPGMWYEDERFRKIFSILEIENLEHFYGRIPDYIKADNKFKFTFFQVLPKEIDDAYEKYLLKKAAKWV